jgi:hypothetical protein
MDGKCCGNPGLNPEGRCQAQENAHTVWQVGIALLANPSNGVVPYEMRFVCEPATPGNTTTPRKVVAQFEEIRIRACLQACLEIRHPTALAAASAA